MSIFSPKLCNSNFSGIISVGDIWSSMDPDGNNQLAKIPNFLRISEWTTVIIHSCVFHPVTLYPKNTQTQKKHPPPKLYSKSDKNKSSNGHPHQNPPFFRKTLKTLSPQQQRRRNGKEPLWRRYFRTVGLEGELIIHGEGGPTGDGGSSDENCQNSLVDELVISLRNIGSEKILVFFLCDTLKKTFLILLKFFLVDQHHFSTERMTGQSKTRSKSSKKRRNRCKVDGWMTRTKRGNHDGRFLFPGIKIHQMKSNSK